MCGFSFNFDHSNSSKTNAVKIHAHIAAHPRTTLAEMRLSRDDFKSEENKTTSKAQTQAVLIFLPLSLSASLFCVAVVFAIFFSRKKYVSILLHRILIVDAIEVVPLFVTHTETHMHCTDMYKMETHRHGLNIRELDLVFELWWYYVSLALIKIWKITFELNMLFKYQIKMSVVTIKKST